MTNNIKVGDKVYFTNSRNSWYNSAKKHLCEVTEVNGDNAVIKLLEVVEDVGWYRYNRDNFINCYVEELKLVKR